MKVAWILIPLALGVPLTHAGAQDAQPASGSEPFVDAYVEASSPGKEHERLAALVGAWRVQGRYRFTADQEWRQFTARADIAPILDGRFVVERFESESPHGRLEGLRLLGHDNLRQSFVFLGLTNQGTQIDHLESDGKGDTEPVVLRGSFRHPEDGTISATAIEYVLGKPGSFSLAHYLGESSHHGASTSAMAPIVEAAYHREALEPRQHPLELLGSTQREATITPWTAEGRSEAHGLLASISGRWRVEGRFRFEPEGTWERFRASSHLREILGGRFLLERIRGEQTASWPVPYAGLRLVGFDSATGRFQYAALNNLSTAIQFSEGPGAAEEQSIVVDGATLDPISRTSQSWRTSYRVAREHLVLREYPTDSSGRSYLGISADYRREEVPE